MGHYCDTSERRALQPTAFDATRKITDQTPLYSTPQVWLKISSAKSEPHTEKNAHIQSARIERVFIGQNAAAHFCWIYFCCADLYLDTECCFSRRVGARYQRPRKRKLVRIFLAGRLRLQKLTVPPELPPLASCSASNRRTTSSLLGLHS